MHRNIQSLSVHIVIACWLYIFALVALTMKNGFAGAATFLVIGCGPVALYALLSLRRLRLRRDQRASAAAQAPPPPRSGLEHEMHEGNDRDA